MQTRTDAELLRDYALKGAEGAFEEIARRYADYVYSAALRQVADPELARDVSQVVFAALARKAGALRPDTVLIGWLCRAVRFTALTQLRNQRRRLLRERQAMELAAPSPESENDWSAIRPVLDEAIAELGDEDRNALLLRFFKNESLAAVGLTLGVSEGAAQKRVSRALDKLRDYLARRGIRTTATALAVVLAAHGVSAAPAGLSAFLAANALAQAASGASTSLFNLFALNPMKTIILSLIVGGIVAGLTVQQVRTQRQLREAQATIERQNQSVRALRAAEEQLAAQSNELQSLRVQAKEAARLRDEVGRLRHESEAMRASTAAQTSRSPDPLAASNMLPSISISAKFVLLPTDSLKALEIPWTRNADGSATGLLTKEQFKVVNQALDGASDATILGTPRVVTSPGTTAFLSARQGVSGAQSNSTPGGILTPVSGPAILANSPATTGGSADPGLTLGVLAYPTQDASAFDLDLTASYIPKAAEPSREDGSQDPVRTTQVKARLALAKGQTAILARELPDTGVAEADGTVAGAKSLLIFVTPAPFKGSLRLANIVTISTNNAPATPEN